MCYLTLFAANYSLCQHLASTILNDIIVYIYISGFKKKSERNGQEMGGWGKGVRRLARGNLLSVMKIIY